ncbi:unnamed protein product [Calypogeia fissa]
MGKTKSTDLTPAEILEGKQLLEYEFERQAAQKIDVSVDLITAAKRQLCFLRAVHCVPGLHRGPAVVVAIKRYYKCWMPIAAEQSNLKVKQTEWEKAALLPPFDVQWVWHCHRLNPVEYRKFCMAKYQRVIDFPVFAAAESETAARERCRKLWVKWHPREPFDSLSLMRKLSSGQVYPIEEQSDDEEEFDLVPAIARQSSFYFQVSQPYVWEEAFLRVALHRYKCFLHILRKSEGKILCVPTYDIGLIWHAHQLSPVSYAKDTEALLGCLMDHDDTMENGPNTKLGNGFQDTVRLWEKTFGLPYERAGAMPRGTQALNPTPLPSEDGGFERVPLALTWDYHPKNVNLSLKVLSPRYVVEVCVMIRSALSGSILQKTKDMFFRLRVLAAHKLMKLDIAFLPDSNQQPQWQKLWLLQCEVGTKGLVLELRKHAQSCFNTVTMTKLVGQSFLKWQEPQDSPVLSVNRLMALKRKRSKKLKQDMASSCVPQIRFGASITPPVPAPYLLKSVPDRVTDNSGAMISSIFLKMARNQPQQGRWMSRTVLDHSGNECFVIRVRAARGIWRKGGDRPVGVDWNERVVHICEGGWTYISDFIGIAPEKIVASATPIADDIGQYKLKWSFSSGEILTISRPMDEENWERNLNFELESSTYGLARLLNGRKLAYEVPGARSEEEEGFVTVVRHTPDAPQGKATALLNWKVSAMEVHPEEDVLLVLLLCTATLRSVADLGGTNYENLFARRRAKEVKPGVKDWGSVVLDNPKSQPNLLLWYVNVGHLLESKEGSSSSGSDASGRDSSYDMSEWEGGKSFAEHFGMAGFGGGMGGTRERRTGSGVRLDGLL